MAQAAQFMEVTLESIRIAQAQFARARDWEKFHTPRNLVMALVGEVGELAEIFQWRGEVAPGLPDFSRSDRKHVGEELSDVLLYLVRLADVCCVDLGAAVMSKIEANARKYPPELCRGKATKYTDLSPSVGCTAEGRAEDANAEGGSDGIARPALAPVINLTTGRTSPAQHLACDATALTAAGGAHTAGGPATAVAAADTHAQAGCPVPAGSLSLARPGAAGQADDNHNPTAAALPSSEKRQSSTADPAACSSQAGVSKPQETSAPCMVGSCPDKDLERKAEVVGNGGVVLAAKQVPKRQEGGATAAQAGSSW